MLTRKHFDRVATILANEVVDDDTRRRLVREFALWFASENGRFDRGRFEAAVEDRAARLARLAPSKAA